MRKMQRRKSVTAAFLRFLCHDVNMVQLSLDSTTAVLVLSM